MKWLKYFICALFLSYSSVWAPYYVSLFGDINVWGRLDEIQRPCNAIGTDSTDCKVEYVIPKELISSLGKDAAIGLGVILHSTQIGCYKNGTFEPGVSYGQSGTAGKTIDSLATYQTAGLGQLQCDNEVVVRVWSPKQYRRYGLIDGMLVGGNALYVARVKKLTEIFREHFLISVTIIFSVVFLFNSILEKITSNSYVKTPTEKFQWAWMGYMVIFSGLFNAFIPFIGASYEITRISNAFSLLARFGPALESLRGIQIYWISRIGSFFNRPWTLGIVTPLLISVALLQLSPVFAKALGPTYLVVSSMFLLASIAGKNPFLFFWSACGLIDGLKVMMVPNLPSSYLTMCFALFAIIDAFVTRVRNSSRILDSLRWARKKFEEIGDSVSIAPHLRDFADRFEIGQISMLVPQNDGSCEILMEKKEGKSWKSQRITSSKIPEIFSHVLTTRESIWNIEEGSLFAENMRKGEAKRFQYRGSHFSVLPLSHNSVPIAGIAFTDFPERHVKETSCQVEIASVTELLFPVIAKFVANKMIIEKSEWADICSSVVQSIHELQARNFSDDSSFMQTVSDAISKKTNCGVFLGYLDPSTRKILLSGFSGLDPDIEHMYRKSQFYAAAHNEQGPVPLSVNRKTPALVSDINWIRPVLHPSTLTVFDASGIKSCASIPIFEAAQDLREHSDRSVWGILWLESKEVGAFSQRHEKGLTEIATAISAALEHRNVRKVHRLATEALSGFVPEIVLSRLIKGENVRVEEEGYLLMADLRESTRLSRRIGADAWVAFVSTLLEPASTIARRYGFEIQAAIWDAIYFTRTSDRHYQDHELHSMCEELSNLFEAGISARFEDSIRLEPYHSRARFCLVYGDISRDVRHSVTSNWTIVGGSMAAISKLEQACKAHTGWIFCGDSVKFLSEDPSVKWEKLETSANGTGEAIYRFRRLFQADKLKVKAFGLSEKIKAEETAPQKKAG